MIQDTSLHAYALLTQNLTDRQKEVLDRLRYFPDVTNMELAVSMGWTVNRITGRVGELRKLGLVLDAGKRPYDMDLDALRSSLQILSKVASGQVTGEADQQKAPSSVMALSDLDGSISDISELIVHATLRYVSVEEDTIKAVGQKLKN